MRNKNFLIIVIGQIISLFGNAIQRFSMSLYLLEFTGSTAVFSQILAISTIPYIIFAPISGKLSDSVNRKKIMVYLDFFCAALIGIYAFILLRGNDSALIVGTVMFILSICYTLYGPAVTSSIPQIVDEENLTSANGIINQVGSIVNVVGPILAGILYGLLGIKVIVIINAVSFLLSAYAFCNIFLVPILSIVAPYFINVLLALPSEIYGIVEGVCVLGMILGGFWISIKPKMFSMKKVHYTYYPMIAGVTLMSILGFIKINNYAMATIFAFGGLLIMLSLSLSNVLTLTFIQKQVPSNMLGRVSAFSVAVATISVAPGQLLYGQVIDMGIPLGIILIVTVIFNIGLVVFIKKRVSDTVVESEEKAA